MSEATLKQIAALTGVSARSVSRAIRGEPGLGEATRMKILETAAQVGYSPNMQARNLRQHTQNFIGLVVPFEDLHANGYVSVRKVTLLQIHLERAGFFTLFGVDDGSKGNLENLIKQWKGLVSTVIFFSWNPEWDARALLSGISIQPIFIDLPSNYGHQLTIDRSRGIRDAIRYFIATGHTRIARCGNISTRDTGFHAAFCNLTNPLIQHHHFILPDSFESGYSIGDRLIQNKFSAVFFDTDRMAFGFLRYCQQHRIDIPEQIAVIGFDDDPWDIYSYPTLSTVAQPIESMVESVMQLIQEKTLDFHHINLATRFIRRESVS